MAVAVGTTVGKERRLVVGCRLSVVGWLESLLDEDFGPKHIQKVISSFQFFLEMPTQFSPDMEKLAPESQAEVSGVCAEHDEIPSVSDYRRLPIITTPFVLIIGNRRYKHTSLNKNSQDPITPRMWESI